MPLQPPVSVVFTGDDAVARPIAVAIRSIIDAAASLAELTVYVVHQMSDHSMDMIRRSCEETTIEFVSGYGLTDHLPAGRGELERLSSAAWIRVFLDVLLPDVGRVIYLDSDVLVLKDLQGLASFDLQGRPIGAAIDYRPTFAEATLEGEWGPRLFDGSERYFNSGVLVCDLDAWRSLDVSGQIAELMGEFGERIHYMDQDALNIVFAHRWTELGERWNNRTVTRLIRRGKSSATVKAAFEEASLLHFSGPYKPWRDSYRDCLGLTVYQGVHDRTAYKGEPLEADFTDHPEGFYVVRSFDPPEAESVPEDQHDQRDGSSAWQPDVA